LTFSTYSSTSFPQGSLLRDVLRPHELARVFERVGIRQVRVDLPAEAEPAELLVGALDAVAERRLAVEEPGDHVDRLDEHLVPLSDARPAVADDVLVEVLPGTGGEAEAVVRDDLHRGGLLRHDRRVVPQMGRSRTS